MKDIIICFLTNKNFEAVKKVASEHFHDFNVFQSANAFRSQIKNIKQPGFIIFPYYDVESDVLSETEKLCLEKYDDCLFILLIDNNFKSEIPDKIYKHFQLILNAGNNYTTVADIINKLVTDGNLKKELGISEKKYTTLVNNLPGITYRCKNDSDWTMLYMSRKTEKLTGYSPRAFIKNKEVTYSDIIVPQDREKVWLAIQKAVKKNQAFQIEYQIKTAEGRTKWVWEQGRPVITDNNEVLLEGVITDIDTYKNLESRIELMRKIVLAMEQSSDLNNMIGIIKQELNKAFEASDIYLLLFDWGKREFLKPAMDDNMEFYKRIPMSKTLDALVIKRNRTVLLNKKEIVKLERQGKLSVDDPIPEVWLGVPLQIKGKSAGIIAMQDYRNEFALNKTDGEILEFLAVQVVVSILKKQAEDEMRKMQQAMEQSPVSAIITDLDGQAIYANRKSTEITGFSLDEQIGKTPDILDPYENITEHHQQIWHSLKSDGLWEGEYLNKNKSGGKYWEYARLSPIKNERHKTTHYLYISEDISQRKKIETELKKAKAFAEESDKLKTAFLANMSHEIRTPMNAIIGFTDMLRNEEYTKEEHEEFLQLIQENSKNLLKTIENIIDIAKIEAGQLVISRSRCSANKILYDNYYAFERKKPKLDKSRIKFTVRQYKENENLFFMSDPIRINQVLSNIIENAFKFTSEGIIEFGYTLLTEDETEYIDYYVKDSGQGVSKSKMESIFNRFTQASDDYMSTSSGTGLGLAISRNIARLMNGDIRVESTEGEGSVFHFILPYIESEPPPTFHETTPKREKKELEYPNKTVLIAEDEDSNFKLLEVMLRKTKVKIERAYNGKQAIDYVIGGNDVDLVLMDVRMPVMNGYEATEHIKKFSPNLPVIIQTAFTLSGDRESSFEAGCDEYLSKPIKAIELYKYMMKYLD
jgi:PAS domain S-box-containing protein